MGRYQQVFELEFDAPADAVWGALKSALESLDGAKREGGDEAARSSEFSTGVTLTSWGEHMTAQVLEGPPARVQVTGKPKGTFLTTKTGEDVHARTIEKRLREEIEQQLGAVA